jgi:tetratricopeptide (TPR) repeat protein
LLATLELKDGIVAVVAGRGLPRWADADKIMIPDKCLDTQLVGHLSETDATKFLERAGVADAAMRQCLIAYTRVAPERVNEVHPLYLGLCFDVVRAASDQGTTLTPEDFRVTPHAENKGRELINRLLRYVDTEIDFSVRALSACRAFNREIYFKLGEALKFQVTEPAFGVLKQFSFVWRVESRGEGWYRIHDLLRRLFLEHGEEVARRADEVLEKHYRERGSADDMAGSAEAIYHSNRLDWERGINEWVEVFDSALSRSNYALCRILIQVRNELLVKTKFELGRLSQLVGNYFAKLARHNEARDEYLESISAYDEALKRAPDLVEAHNDKGLALQSLGDLQAALSQHQEALSSYTASISAYDEALKRAPDDVGAHNNKGLALQSLGDLQAALSQHQEAMNCYEIALKEFRISLKIAPADKRIHERKDRLKKSMEELRRT